MVLVGVELETLVSKLDATTTTMSFMAERTSMCISTDHNDTTAEPHALTTRPSPWQFFFYAYEHLNTRQFYNT